jgi:hypothetical protein
VSEESSVENSEDEDDSFKETFYVVDLFSLITARHFSCSFCGVSDKVWHLNSYGLG